MDEFWKYIWISFPISPWSLVLYLFLSYWASKKLPSNAYYRISWLASWVDSICVLGIIVLIGDIIWLSLCWFRWNITYSMNSFSYIFLPIARNVAMLIVCFLLISQNWIRAGYIKLSREVFLLAGFNVLYLFLWFYLSPGKEWTHWLYAIQNNYACWPYTWFISYPVGRAITSLVYIKMWRAPHAS